MGKRDILIKVKRLIGNISNFEERDVVYVLVETSKIKERELGRSEMKKKFRHLTFYRDWVVHTNLNNPEWFKEKETLNNVSKLLEELRLIINDDSMNQKIQSMWTSFEISLLAIIEDQDILG